MPSSGISTCDAFAMRLRALTPLREVKEKRNDECYYQELCSIIKSFDTTDEQAEEIEQYVHWIIDVNEASMTTDLLSTSLGRVDWHEIARANQE